MKSWKNTKKLCRFSLLFLRYYICMNSWFSAVTCKFPQRYSVWNSVWDGAVLMFTHWCCGGGSGEVYSRQHFLSEREFIYFKKTVEVRKKCWTTLPPALRLRMEFCTIRRRTTGRMILLALWLASEAKEANFGSWREYGIKNKAKTRSSTTPPNQPVSKSTTRTSPLIQWGFPA